MHRSHTRAATVAQQHRKAVRNGNRTHGAGVAGHAGVSFGNMVKRVCVHHIRAVLLSEPFRLLWKETAQARVIACDQPRVVAHVRSQIKAGERTTAHAAVARGNEGIDIRRFWPLRHDPVSGIFQAVARNMLIKLAMSAGKLACQTIIFREAGWVNASVSA